MSSAKSKFIRLIFKVFVENLESLSEKHVFMPHFPSTTLISSGVRFNNEGERIKAESSLKRERNQMKKLA